jgi:hypothetical protein
VLPYIFRLLAETKHSRAAEGRTKQGKQQKVQVQTYSGCSTGKNFTESLGRIANVQVRARSIIQCYLGAQDAPVTHGATCSITIWTNSIGMGHLAHVFLCAQIWIHQFRIGQSSLALLITIIKYSTTHEKQTHYFVWPLQVVVSPAYQRRNSKFNVLYYGLIRQSFKRLKITISPVKEGLQVAY